jgi:hypothetical protein
MSEQERLRHRASLTYFVLTDGKRHVYLTHGLFGLTPDLRGVNTHAANLRRVSP